MLDLYSRKNGQKLRFFYPVHGNKNVLRRVDCVKVASFTGPHGRGITAQEPDGNHRSFLNVKIVLTLE